ncbi:MAG: WbqC family protein [Bacteroidales bacterium]
MSPRDTDTALLSISYLGPVQYITKFLLHPVRIIERYDHYIKQTYRNRCNIMGANGILPLSIPVLKGQDHKTYVRDIRIDYNKKWQKLHWRSIESAYRHSPFFEFYMDEFSPFYEQRFEFLLDFNAALLELILQSLEINYTLRYSSEFMDVSARDCADYREAIHPKRDLSSDPLFTPVTYRQVFAERLGFRANLSIIDLLFNEGPNARSVLEQCIAHPPEHLP